MTPLHYLGLAGILFSIGLLGLIIRRNILLVLLSVELMLNAANLVFVTGAHIHGQVNGQVLAFFVMVISAAEVTIGLALTVLLFRKQDSVDTNEIRCLKG
ncbi:MAG: NADH-quinone oxidoreductase subunit NuoK [Candidatus Omnitrophica bacterium]|nr:NADH-quinone oxidoreductase subunit NuoK [Candidatus Omnitrophota bacterium]